MRLRWLSCLLVVGAACGDSGSDLDGQQFPGTAATGGLTGGTSGSSVGGGGTTSQPTTSGGLAGGSVAGGGVTGGTGTTGTNTGTGSTGTASSLPCDVSAILKEKCQTCHGDPLMSGPMKLITWADLQADSTAHPGTKVYERVQARISDTASPMPPAGRPQLTAAEKQTLNAYLAAGAQASTASCAGTPSGTGGETGGDDFGDYLPPDSECDYIMELTAHGGQTPGDTTPFEAPQGGDHYEIFYFKPMWNEKVHTIRIDPITDNGAVLHHWLLYMEDGNGSGDGTHKSDVGLQSSSSQLLSGWAPGNKSIPLGHDKGLQTISGANARFAIEIHYNTNANPPNRKDRSGARLCVTKKLRDKEAAVHWLGTQAIINLGLGATYDAVGTCSVKKESHIIAHSPHMHLQGRYMKSIVTRKDGTSSTITDQPFTFDDQQIYRVDSPTHEIVVGPGDTIKTTCTYDASRIFTFGPNTDQEMCYNFVVAWPAGSLSNGSAGIVGGQNSCIDGI